MSIWYQFSQRETLRRAGLLTLVAATGIAVSGCGATRSALGLDKSPPDEFAVVTKAPLIVPPDFSLRPPKPGAPRPQEIQPSQTARTALLGGEAAAEDGGPTAGEAALLAQTGADRADSNVRAVLNDEYGRLKEKDEGFADRIIFWRDGDELPPASVINASQESERLKSGQPLPSTPASSPSTPPDPTPDSELPTIEEEKSGGFLGRIRDLF